MIMAGYEYVGKEPFKNVYFTGIVRDNLGRKMSKSLGNSPDPLDLIAKFGADGVRMGMMLAAPAGNDIMFDERLCEQGRNFCNKIWNAFRLLQGWEVDTEIQQGEVNRLAVEWFENRLSIAIAEINDLFEKFRLNEALMVVYRLFWDEFSSWYLEMVKPAYGKPIDKATMEATRRYFDSLLRLLHPFMPFITEELWQHLDAHPAGESIMYAQMPVAKNVDQQLESEIKLAKEIISGIRAARAKKNIPSKEVLKLNVIGTIPSSIHELIKKLANVDEITMNADKDAAAASFMVDTTEFNVPLASAIDVDAERSRIEKEIKYLEGFRTSIEKKLANERFVSNAPAAVVEGERKKLADTLQKLAANQATLDALK